jgi:hypothetical protein
MDESYNQHIVNQRNHFEKRLWQRHRLTITEEVYFMLCRTLLFETPVTEILGGIKAVHKVIFRHKSGDKIVYVLFDNRTCAPVTCIPPDQPWYEWIEYRKPA